MGNVITPKRCSLTIEHLKYRVIFHWNCYDDEYNIRQSSVFNALSVLEYFLLVFYALKSDYWLADYSKDQQLFESNFILRFKQKLEK